MKETNSRVKYFLNFYNFFFLFLILGSISFMDIYSNNIFVYLS
jgi:hypothetical protein